MVWLWSLFQSSSGQKAECNHHDARRVILRLRVSILIRPEGRMQLRLDVRSFHEDQVSILIRPEGRMQPLYRVDSGRGQNRTLRPLSAFWPTVFAGEQDVGPPKG